MRINPGVDGKASVRDDLAVAQKGAQAVVLLDVRPPEPDPIDTAGQAFGLRRMFGWLI